MNEVQIFESADFGKIRTAEVDGKVLFCGKDIATALGYVKATDAVRKHCKGISVLETPSTSGIQKTSFIPESDVYRLAFSSKLPTAERFTDWVTSEVLPSIRRHGLYAIDDVLANPDTLIQALTELKKERQLNAGYQQTIAVQNQQIAELTPKASYYDLVLNCADLVAISIIAKDYGWSATKMNKCLNKKGISYCVTK